MKEKDFDRKIKELFEPKAESMGFCCAGGRGCTYYRKINEELFHFISFDIKRNNKEFEVHVFPGTPRLGQEQWKEFPDFIGIPTGRAAGLNAKSGIGEGASKFSCKSEQVLESVLLKIVIPALEYYANDYLSKFTTLSDIIPVLEHQQWASLLK